MNCRANCPGAAALDDILLPATIYVHKSLGARSVVMLLPEDGELNLAVAWPPIDQLDPGETSAARWAFEKAEPAGWRTGTLPNVRFQFPPSHHHPRRRRACAASSRRTPRRPSRLTTNARSISFSNRPPSAVDRALLVKDS